MKTLRMAVGLLLFGVTGAQAADLSLTGPGVHYSSPPHRAWRRPAPYFVVNQGPVYSGPGITVGPLAWVNTDVRLRYPAVDVMPIRVRWYRGERWSGRPHCRQPVHHSHRHHWGSHRRCW